MSERSSQRSSAGAGAVALAVVVAVASAVVATGTAACTDKRGAGGPGSGAGAGTSSGSGSSRAGEPLRVAAASDLATAFPEVGKAFEAATGKKVDFSFGSTGLLSKQIAEGAPYDVFAAANVSYVDEVVRANACDGSTKQLYAKGRIVIWSTDKSMLPSSLEGLRDKKVAKVAIANPDHAPYGLAAQQALTKAGVWADVKPRAVYGENVQQTMMFAQSGNAEVAIVALSLALQHAPGERPRGGYVLIDADLHAPLDQAMVICKGGSAGNKPNEARAFLDFVASEQGHAIMRKYGFLLPGEAAPPSP
jgi:molybdate transport system substrate-binding protein